METASTSIILPGDWAENQAFGVIQRAEACGVTSEEAIEVINRGYGLGGHYLASRESGVPHKEAMHLAAEANTRDSLVDRPSQWM